ncbi:MAG: ribosomal protein S18-alanine N-acetyltransferase [Fastidiosipilaceae bacterium]|jgi:ribosomal-protein-alanine N-acetyltransferase
MSRQHSSFTIVDADLSMADSITALEMACFFLPLSKRGVLRELRHSKTVFLAAVPVCGLNESERGTPTDVLGYLFYRQITDFADVGNLAVREDARQLGIGTALLAEMRQRCLGEGIRVVQLEVRETNLAARALYRSVGFVEVGRRPRYYLDTGETAILMDWTL